MVKTKTAVLDYIKATERELKQGNATEHTHRPALKTLLETIGGKDLLATNEPRRIKCGAPDFLISKGSIPMGHIEAKDIGKSLDSEEKSDQMKRYLGSLDNLILTDYLEFRWYVLGEFRTSASLGTVGPKGEIRIHTGGEDSLNLLLNCFFTSQTPTVNNSKDLAERMAGIAQLMRSAIINAFKDEPEGGELHRQFTGFRDILLHQLTENEFADMYAQTIAYGLFAARCNHNHKINERFTRFNAVKDLPKTNPFLKRLFQYIQIELNNDALPFVWSIDELAELLNRSDMEAILNGFGRQTRQEDPVVHFYETFLKAYDPNMREMRGVYYTPEPVVSYIVRSVDEILKTQFGLKNGLANTEMVEIDVTPEVKSKHAGKDEYKQSVHKVQILDPATGTGTFLYTVIQQIYETVGKHNKGSWSAYIKDHLLPRLYGFELLMAFLYCGTHETGFRASGNGL